VTYNVGAKGQVVIAKEIRDELGIGPGWMTFQQVVDGHVEIYFVPPEHDRSLKGTLAKYAKNVPSGASWRKIRDTAWEAHVKERYESDVDE
jgi:AbrB family looped-hinge helix DNA binding protein